MRVHQKPDYIGNGIVEKRTKGYGAYALSSSPQNISGYLLFNLFEQTLIGFPHQLNKNSKKTEYTNYNASANLLRRMNKCEKL